MLNFCNVADFTLHLFICKFVTFLKRLKEASDKIFKYGIYQITNIIFCRHSQRKYEGAK